MIIILILEVLKASLAHILNFKIIIVVVSVGLIFGWRTSTSISISDFILLTS